MKKLLLLLLLIFCCFNVRAEVSVFFARGEVWLLDNSLKKVRMLHCGDILNSGSQIVLNAGSEAILMNSKKQFAVIRDTGHVFKYSDIEKLLQKCSESSLLDNLKNEIAKGLSHHPSAEDIQKLYMQETGGIVRADCKPFSVHYPGNNSVASIDSLFFSWPSVRESYHIRVEAYPFESLKKSVIVDKDVNDTVYHLNNEEIKRITDAEKIQWQVSGKGEDLCYYYFLSISDLSEINNRIKEITNKSNDESELTNKLLVRASMFEEAGFMREAQLVYLELINLQKDNKVFEQLYLLFKLRTGLK